MAGKPCLSPSNPCLLTSPPEKPKDHMPGDGRQEISTAFATRPMNTYSTSMRHRLPPRAGYSKRTAQAQSSRLLSNVMIKAEIARLRREAEIRTKVDLDRILEEYARFAFAGLSKFIRIDQQGQPILDLSRCGPERTRPSCRAASRWRWPNSTDQN